MPHPFEDLQFNKANLLRLLGSLTTGVVQTFSAGTTGFTPSSATAGNVTLAGTLNVANGGTAATSLTANGVLIGRGAVSAVVVTAPGTTGTVLTGVTGAAPVFSSLSSQVVTTWAGGTTGLTPAAATSGAVSLAGTLVVGNGGTGATTLTSHGVLLGNGTGVVAATAEGATGTVLTGVTGANPAFTALPTATNSTTFLTGDVSGGAVNTFVSGPNTGSVGANGQTWLIIAGGVYTMATAGQATFRIFNGSAGIKDSNLNIPANSSFSAWEISTVFNLSAATTFTLQVADNVGSTGTLKATSTNGTTNKATSITAIRLV